MRIKHWLTALGSLVCATLPAKTSLSQQPFMPGQNAQYGPGQTSPYAQDGMQNPAYPPLYSTYDPTAIYPAGTPANMQPYPNISPYGDTGTLDRETHYRRNGLWFRELFNKHRDYEYSAEAIYVQMADPGRATIGAPYIPADPQTGFPINIPIQTYGVASFPGVAGGGGGGGGGAAVAAGGPFAFGGGNGYVYPFPFLRFNTQGNNLTAPTVATTDYALFPIRSLSGFNSFSTPGIRLKWGFTDADGEGMNMSAWWGFRGNQEFVRGQDSINGQPIDKAMILQTAGAVLFTRNGAVSFDTGQQVRIFSTGTTGTINAGTQLMGTQKYDVLYQLAVSSVAGGANLNLLQTPIFNSGAIKLTPVVAARYMYLNETFAFRGIDSGFGYNIEGPGGVAAAANGIGTFRPDPASPQLTDNLPYRTDLFETQIRSTVSSQMAGPEYGLRYDLGGKRSGFKMWGQTNVGLLANFQQQKVSGFGAGEISINSRPTAAPGNVPSFPVTVADIDSKFSATRNHTHLSGMFESSLFAEAPIFEVIPVLNQFQVLREANFRTGYTHTIIGQVARPGESIVWNGYPKVPTVKTEYKNWYMGQWSFALEWKY